MAPANLQKAQGQVDSLIPLLFHELGDAQAAVDRATDYFRSAVAEFERAAAELLGRYAAQPEVGDLGRFVESCKYACQANLDWG